MQNTFEIQAGRPRTIGRYDPMDESLAEAFNTVFPMNAEAMMLIWNGIYVPINYKYDLGVMIDDVLLMCDRVLTSDDGQSRINWPSNTFDATWSLTWEGGIISIGAAWRSVSGNVVALLSSSLVLPVEDFVAEWKQPLRVCCDALVDAGYNVPGFPRFRAMKTTFDAIAKSGVLY